MATIKDIAKETGLGLATISKYINGGNVLQKNKVAIDTAIDKFGYIANDLARGLRTKKSNIIGVVVPEINNTFTTTIITNIGDILRKNGFGMVVCECHSDPVLEIEVVRFLMSKCVDGIVSMPVSQNDDAFKPVVNAKIPIVLIDRLIPSLMEHANAVIVDNVAASACAVDYLIKNGHKDIGIILGPHNIFTSQQRLLGYSQEMIKNLIHPIEARTIFSDYSLQGGYESMNHLLQDKGLTAVFVTNYEMTLGAIIALNEAGIQIPKQLSIIGFDNMQLAQVINPRLTIITQPLEEIGQQVAKILLSNLIDGHKKPQTILLSADIIEGKSVKSLL